jgi:acyl-CoA hydrolase
MVNPQMPRTFGDGTIHCSHMDAIVYINQPLHYRRGMRPLSPQQKKIGELIAENLVADGATIQTGIGKVPDACLYALKHHKDLGFHSEMMSDGVMDLVRAGVMTNSRKKIFPGKLTCSFVIGSQKLYDFVDDSPMCCKHTSIMGGGEKKGPPPKVENGVKNAQKGQKW